MEDVIFAGTRDRNPTGMAEVSLTLIDPEIYGGPDTNAPTEIEIQDDLPAKKTGMRPRSAPRPLRKPNAQSKRPRPGKTEEVEGAAAEAQEVGQRGAADRRPSHRRQPWPWLARRWF